MVKSLTSIGYSNKKHVLVAAKTCLRKLICTTESANSASTSLVSPPALQSDDSFATFLPYTLAARTVEYLCFSSRVRQCHRSVDKQSYHKYTAYIKSLVIITTSLISLYTSKVRINLIKIALGVQEYGLGLSRSRRNFVTMIWLKRINDLTFIEYLVLTTITWMVWIFLLEIIRKIFRKK